MSWLDDQAQRARRRRRTVRPPTFSLLSGSYEGEQELVLESATPGATIYYTTDGTRPTEASTEYSGPITVSESQIVKAFAAKAGKPKSPVTSVTLVIT